MSGFCSAWFINPKFQDAEAQELLQADFEVGQLFRDQIVPRAVLFYTKEAIEENDIFEYDGDEDEDEVLQSTILFFFEICHCLQWSKI